MSFRLYLVPRIGAGIPTDLWRPKYFTDGAVSDAIGWMEYRAWFLVGADLPASEHSFMAGQPDVTTIPQNLDTTLNASQVSATQAMLEAADLPAQWVTTALTWRKIVRIVCGMLQFSIRFHGMNGREWLFQGTLTLDSTVGDLSPIVRQRLTDAAVGMGLNTGSITLATTLRETLRYVGEQLQSMPLQFGDVFL
jgi:hypothetical protein